MGRTLTPERQQKKAQAIILRKMGWTQQRIADEVGVPQRTLSRWFSQNGMPTIVARNSSYSHNNRNKNVAKPTFLSWCGNVEDFIPEDGIKFDLIIADPPWNISKPNEIKRRAGKPIKKNFGIWDFFDTSDNYLNNIKIWLQKLYKLSKNPSWCWFWCSYRYISYIATLAEAIGWEEH